MQAVSHVLLSLDKPFQDEITTESGIKLFLDPNYRPEWNVTVTGTIAAIPSRYKNYELKVGDEVAFSFRVVEQREFKSAGDNYFPTAEGSHYYQKWTNSKGNWLTVAAYKKSSNFIGWFGSCRTYSGDIISGIEGTESEVGRWMGQFNFGSPTGFKFKNLIEYEGVEYWKANIEDIYVKKDGGRIKSVGNRIICKPIEVDLTKKMSLINGIHYDDNSVRGRWMDRAEVLQGKKELELLPGDVIGFEQKYCEVYEFWGKEYFLLDPNFINGIWN